MTRSASEEETPPLREPVDAVRIDILGPLQVTVERAGAVDQLVPTTVHVNPSEEKLLREIAQRAPGVATKKQLKDRLGTEPDDALSSLRRKLRPHGLSITKRPGERSPRYTVVRYVEADGSESEPVPIESDVMRFRAAAREAIAFAGEDPPRPDAQWAQAALAIDLWRDEPDEHQRVGLLSFHDRLSAQSRAHPDVDLDVQVRYCYAEAAVVIAEQATDTHRVDTAEQVVAGLPSVGSLDALAGNLKGRVDLLRDRFRVRREPVGARAEVFLSAPMAALGRDTYDPVRKLAVRVADALRRSCGITHVYCAAEDIDSPSQFDPEWRALQEITVPLMAADRYFLLLPERLPSSVLVEAGMALALQRRSVYAVHRRSDLPFLLRQVADAHVEALARVRVIEYRDDDDLVRQIADSGPHLFP